MAAEPVSPPSAGVVVAVHGWAPYLAEALDAVLAEGPAEVVVVDDGSPDPLALHPDHDGRCRLVRREERGGPAAARNAGVAALHPQIGLVALCDADDAWEPGSLAPRVAALAAAPEAAGAFGRARIVGPDGCETGERWPALAAGRFDDLAALYEANPILTSSVILRREAFPGFDESYPAAEDWELWLRLLARGDALLHVPEAVVRYRRHAGGLSARVSELAAAQRRLHERYAELVSPEASARAIARDRAAQAAGLASEGRHAQARALLPPSPRRALLAVPGLRGLVGRRDPYRRG
jgi:glycosyltransferase involved in cell wall biosynthesis